MPTDFAGSVLRRDITELLKRIKHARADGDPTHIPHLCAGCYVCILERQLDRLLDKVPRP